MISHRYLILAVLFVTNIFHVGCGSSTSTKDRWQAILQDGSRTNEDKLTAIAQQMFDTQSVECTQMDGRFQMSIVVNGLDPTVVLKTLAGKDLQTQNSAQKNLQLRNLISQLGNYIHYMKSHHLGRVRIELMVNDVNGEVVADTRSRAYELELEPEDFDAFIEASKMKSKEAVQTSESIWRTTFDRWT